MKLLVSSGWAALGLLLAATLAASATLDRRAWPSFVGDEATYLMQAQSLAWDFDLRYTPEDHDRFVAQWGRPPEGLILQSSDGGRTLVYGKPAAYPLFIAPFVRLSPTRGAAVANALLLALAAVLAARTLQRRIGDAAPLWVAAWVFASVAFAYVFWAHSDLFLMCLVAIALAFVDAKGSLPAAGALLGIVILSRPLYAGLLLPVALAVPPEGRKKAALGAAVLILVATLAGVATRGTWTSYGGDRRSFYSYTGFPAGDTAASWEREIAERGTHSWVKEETFQMGFDPRQAGWNLGYYLVGRHVGILPYFLPLVLGFLAYRRGEGRWALVLAVLLAAASLFWLRPFNFYGGGGSMANRYFLPLYPALWFLAARPVRPVRGALAAVAVTVLAAPFLLPLWSAPRAFPLASEGGYRYVGDFARRWLPFETTQSHLKPSGHEDLLHNRLWVKLLTPSLRPEGGRLLLAPGQPGGAPGGQRASAPGNPAAPPPEGSADRGSRRSRGGPGDPAPGRRHDPPAPSRAAGAPPDVVDGRFLPL